MSDVNLLDLDLDLEELGGVFGENFLGVLGGAIPSIREDFSLRCRNHFHIL